MKTNKTFMKRVRVTKNGKIKVRAKGHNHFNAKESGGEGMKKKRSMQVFFTNKAKARFLPGRLK